MCVVVHVNVISKYFEKMISEYYYRWFENRVVPYLKKFLDGAKEGQAPWLDKISNNSDEIIWNLKGALGIPVLC